MAVWPEAEAELKKIAKLPGAWLAD